MKRFLSLIFLLLATSLVAKELPFAKPEDVGMSSAKLREIETAVGQHLDKNHLAGGITMVLRKGHIVHLESHGYRDLEKRVPMTEDTIFRIYSMTKAIVSVGVMMLVEEGKVELDQPITDFFPEFNDLKVYKEGGHVPAKRMITVRDLLRHTSGFTYGFFGDHPVDKLYQEAGVLWQPDNSPEFIQRLSKLPLVFHPGDGWAYSVSTDVLGILIERVTKLSLEGFMRLRILDPLGMVDTSFHVPLEKHHRFAHLYHPTESGELKPNQGDQITPFLTPPLFQSGGGGLVSTMRDYARFLQMVANRGELHGTRFLKASTIDEMRRNHVSESLLPFAIGSTVFDGMGFGLGFDVQLKPSQVNPGGRNGEFGWDGAASTHYWINQEEELVGLTMEQTDPFNVYIEHAIKGIVYDAITD